MMLDRSLTPQNMATKFCIVRHLAGSRAYGTATPTSDIDYRGVFVSAPQYWTPFYNVETVQLDDEEDTVYHEVGKFLTGVCKQNPNILETMWIDESDIVYKHAPIYDYMRSYRYQLLTSDVAKTYVGYAMSQLHRIEGHHKWLKMMSAGKEEIRELYSKRLLTVNQLRNHFEHTFLDDLAIPYVDPVAIEAVEYDWCEVIQKLLPYKSARLMCNIPPMVIEFCKSTVLDVWNAKGFYISNDPGPGTYAIQKDATDTRSVFDGRGSLITNHVTNESMNQIPVDFVCVNSAHATEIKRMWNNYHTWRNDRNVVRSELEVKYGYDTKHASHLIRLLRSGLEVLKTGELVVKRPDAQELLDIRSGSMTLDELMRMTDNLRSQIDEAVENTKLQSSIDYLLPARMVLTIREMMHGKVV